MTLIPLPDSLNNNDPICGTGVNGEKLKKFEKFQVFSGTAFTIINIITSSLIGLGMMIIRHSNTIPLRMVNMTNHCNDSVYNMKLIQPPNNFFSYFAVIVIFLIVFITTIFKTFITTQNKLKAWRKIVGEVFRFGLNFFLFCVMMELLKLITGIPSPDYFSHEGLQDYYCSNTSAIKETQSEELEALDKSLRTSFPSYRAAVFGYCTTFLYLYLDHIDVYHGLHTLQQLIFLSSGSYSIHLLLNHIKFGENHVEDVIAGVIIGFFYAIQTIRNLFGTVLHQRTHPWNIEERTYNNKLAMNSNDLSDSSNYPAVNLNKIVITNPLNLTWNSGFKEVFPMNQEINISLAFIILWYGLEDERNQPTNLKFLNQSFRGFPMSQKINISLAYSCGLLSFCLKLSDFCKHEFVRYSGATYVINVA